MPSIFTQKAGGLSQDPTPLFSRMAWLLLAWLLLLLDSTRGCGLSASDPCELPAQTTLEGPQPTSPLAANSKVYYRAEVDVDDVQSSNLGYNLFQDSGESNILAPLVLK